MNAVSEPTPVVAHPYERLSQISRLATLLADQVLDAQIMKRPVRDDQIRSLLDAGLLLTEYGVALPSLLGQIRLAAERPELATAPELPASADDAGRLARLYRSFRGATR